MTDKDKMEPRYLETALKLIIGKRLLDFIERFELMAFRYFIFLLLKVQIDVVLKKLSKLKQINCLLNKIYYQKKTLKMV